MAAVAAVECRVPGQRQRPGPAEGAVVRRQRVRVPLRLVCSPFYADVALSVYVKVAALAARPEGCQAKTVTIAAYLGMSVSSVERGMTQLLRPGPDGVVELRSRRRAYAGGKGESALRTVRPVARGEGFVWLPVAAAEDLTPRQLRVYALIAYAQVRRIALTEAELAAGLRHRSGKRAGEALSVTAASAVVDEVEAAGWVSVQRRAGERGRHRYVAHDIAPEARPAGVCPVAGGGLAAAVDNGSRGPVSSQAGEGSGSQAGEGSLAYEESLRTDSPDDERAPGSSAVGEAEVGRDAGPVSDVRVGSGGGGLALRAGASSQHSPSRERGDRCGGSRRSSYTGPQLTVSPRIYAVLEPVHWLLARVDNAFVERKIAREVGRQLREGMEAGRLRHRLAVRLAGTMPSEIRDPGRWLLGVALPRWGCGHLDCETGVMWSTGKPCEVCAEAIADRASAREGEECERRRRQAEAEQVRRRAACAETQARAGQERAAGEAADEERQALPCEDCGAGRAGGLCETCRCTREARDLAETAVLYAAAAVTDIGDADAVAAAAAHTRRTLARDIEVSRQEFLQIHRLDGAEGHDEPGQLDLVLALRDQLAAERCAAGARRTALAVLARSPEAEAEAQRAFAAEKRRRRHRWCPDGPVAVAAAEKAVTDARERAAGYLLNQRLEQLRTAWKRCGGAAVPAQEVVVLGR
ncbi:hypothetical protein ACFP1Z_32720 [Streptomyces gamaensis]|uniref:Helix-turn-helix domain-containing protein n=1 Tax=Streptomyces gamaensis TaxID=1763542 RepID=A0ABW0ZC61_9ACTN